MALVKLEILVEGGTRIPALFNPSKIAITKNVRWQPQRAERRDVPELQFKNGEGRTVTLDLILDTYDTPEMQKQSVRKYTDELFKLALVNGKLHRPPVCELSWGGFGVFFKGILERLQQQFTLFMEDGTPVRATSNCTFKEWRTNPDDLRRQDRQSSDITKTRILKHGETLSSIAAEEYLDPTLWRPIADENELDDPLSVTPGTVLLIPILKYGNSPQRRSSD